MYGLYAVATDFKFDRLIWLACLEVDAQLAFLDQSVTADYEEEFPLAVVSVLAFCYARFGDVHRELSVI